VEKPGRIWPGFFLSKKFRGTQPESERIAAAKAGFADVRLSERAALPRLAFFARGARCGFCFCVMPNRIGRVTPTITIVRFRHAAEKLFPVWAR
jgi:hypothetical protein